MKAAIFDGDDTLWRTEILYDQARNAARGIVSNYGVDPAQWEARQRIIDVENVAVYGFSSDRFPASCLEAFREVSQSSKLGPHSDVEQQIIYAAQSVFRANPELLPNAANVLYSLRSAGVRLALLTKGDLAVQRDRIDQSGLAPLFDSIEIVSEKTTETVRNMLDNLRVRASDAWMIGNSFRSDILPALVLGVRGIWIEAPVWEYERDGVEPTDTLVYKATDLREIIKIIV
jgi:putative hydrolase of the HAD superfamily